MRSMGREQTSNESEEQGRKQNERARGLCGAGAGDSSLPGLTAATMLDRHSNVTEVVRFCLKETDPPAGAPRHVPGRDCRALAADPEPQM